MCRQVGLVALDRTQQVFPAVSQEGNLLDVVSSVLTLMNKRIKLTSLSCHYVVSYKSDNREDISRACAHGNGDAGSLIISCS